VRLIASDRARVDLMVRHPGSAFLCLGISRMRLDFRSSASFLDIININEVLKYFQCLRPLRMSLHPSPSHGQ
jgi:hypothetical protein